MNGKRPRRKEKKENYINHKQNERGKKHISKALSNKKEEGKNPTVRNIKNNNNNDNKTGRKFKRKAHGTGIARDAFHFS